MHTMRSFWLFLGLLLTFTTLLTAQTEYKYSYVPKKVYENQVFPVTIVMSQSTSNTVPSFMFDHSSTVKPLFNIPLTIRNGNDSFYTFYFKAKDKDIRIPPVTIRSEDEEVTFRSQHITIQKLKAEDSFSSVLAADMKIKNSQVSNYDEKNHIVSISIEAYEANLEDIQLQNVIESGIDSLERHFSKVKAEFYVVVPLDRKEVVFSYFNTIKKQYITMKVPAVVVDSSVTTQSELNPKEDNFEKLKKYSLMTIAGFFLLMFLFKRDFFYLVLGVVSIITLLTLYIPHKKICVQQGSPLYILPTATSTISTKIDEKLDTLLLAERDGYKKVEYKEGIIGWIKNENLCQN